MLQIIRYQNISNLKNFLNFKNKTKTTRLSPKIRKAIKELFLPNVKKKRAFLKKEIF
jgi:hypothetical protein